MLSKLVDIYKELSKLFVNSIRFNRMKRGKGFLKIENVFYQVTDACNSRCKHCFMWKNPQPKNSLSPKELEKIFKEDIFSNIKNVLLSGGEPVLRKDINEIISAIHRALPEACIILSTNGILADRVLDVIRFGIKENILIDCGVSLDGIGKDHNESRGIKNNFEKVDYLLKEWIKLKDEYKEKMGEILIGHTLSNLTVNTLKDVDEYSKKIGIPFVTQLYEQFDYYNNVDDKSKVKNYLKEDNKDLIKGIQSLKPSFHNEILLAAVKHKLNFKCSALNSFFIIKHDGSVAPCLRFIDSSAGNLKTQTVTEVWYGDEAKKIRQQVENCECCSNSWANEWSFESWFYPFIGMRIKNIFKKLLYNISK
jgi:MoaA/NifB/PqqE/SkfB family radical SAM enzyme